MMRAAAQPVLPGAVIGLMGGGQLGRMTALAARALGYRVHVLDPDPDCAARGVCDRFVQGPFDDPQAASELARGAQVVTCEREDIGIASLCALERSTLLRPGRHVLEVVQDRGAQKDWLAKHGFAVGPYRVLAGFDDLSIALRELGGAPRLKSRRGGFDGRSQWSTAGCSAGRSASELWAQLEGVPLIAEQDLDLASELSVMVARGPSGAMTCFPIAHNFHQGGVLETSVIPGAFDDALSAAATTLAQGIATQLDVVGVLAVEMFLTTRGELLVNELAPRPHNTFHATELACATSQFEQLVRAICGLPLGETAAHRPTAIGNLFGDLWLEGKVERLIALLGVPGLHVRLYGKAPRARRKLGHVACTAHTPEAALQGVRAALQELDAQSQDAPQNPIQAAGNRP